VMSRMNEKVNPNREEILILLSAYGAREIGVIEMLGKDDVPDDFKGAIADVVGVQKVMEACLPVEKLLMSTDNSELKLHLIEALEKIGTVNSCDAILKSIDDSDFRVRLKAVNALERLAGEKYMDVARRMLDDSDIFVRRNAAEAISRMGVRGLALLDDVMAVCLANTRAEIMVILEEKKFKRMRWRFRYGEAYT